MEGNYMQQRQSTTLKVAKSRTRLSILIIIQAIIQFVGILTLCLSVLKDKNPNVLTAVQSIVASYICLLILELGRRHSQVDYLRVYMLLSSAAILMSMTSVFLTIFLLQFIQDSSIWETKKFELLTRAGILLGALIHVFLIFTTNSLIRNMSPPTRAIDELLKFSDYYTLLNGKTRNEREKMEGNSMQQGKCTTGSGSGRPSGADGYGMVVARYTKVAKGELRFFIMVLTQLIIQMVGFLTIFLSVLKEGNPNLLAFHSIVIGYISLLILHLGQSQRRVDYLRFYRIVSSTAVLMSMSCVVLTIVSLEDIQDSSIWETKKFELLTNVGILLGALLHVFLIFTANSQIRIMSPPLPLKRAIDELP